MQLNFVLQDGRHLRDVTYAHPVLLLFLRQLGCTFCREAVRDLSQLRDAFDARGVEVVLVHQGTLEQGDEVLAQFGGGHFARVADPARKLYAEFNLKLASTGRAFGIPMWLRAFEVVRSGVSLGKLVGDGWQMPGCFVLHQGRILSSFPYDMVSDRPDYLAFVDAALTQDVQQLGQLMPDGRIQSLSLPPALQRWQKRVLEGRARLLLVGGNGSLPARFEPTLAHLREHMAARVVEVAGQGGRKAAALPDTLEGFAQDLARELDREARTLHRAGAEGPLVLYGHGIGGLILAHACRWMEEKPERLILHAPVGVHLAQRRFPSLMKLPGMRPLARMLLGVESLATLTARRLMQEHSEATVMDMQNFARGYREAASFSRLFDVVEPLTALEGLEHLTVPTVLLWGGARSGLGRISLGGVGGAAQAGTRAGLFGASVGALSLLGSAGGICGEAEGVFGATAASRAAVDGCARGRAGAGLSSAHEGRAAAADEAGGSGESFGGVDSGRA